MFLTESKTKHKDFLGRVHIFQKSVQRNNVWYDTKDGRRVRAAPTCNWMTMILSQAVGGNKTAVTATIATICGWQRTASSCI